MSVWTHERIPGQANRHSLGVWLTRRKLSTAAWLPGLKWRRELRGKPNYWYVFDFPLTTNQTLEKRNTLTTTFIWLGSMVSTLVGGTPANPGVRFNITDVKSKKRMNVIGINDVSFAGTATAPFFHRRPYRFQMYNTIAARAVNLQAATNTTQLVLYGVID